jgi:hypothetical protein
MSVLTTVEWNATNSALEIVHRIHAHDAEVGLQMTQGGGVFDITQVQNQARLMLYLEKAFTLADGAGKRIALAPVGAELQAEAILAYQEAKLPAPPAELRVGNSILCDVFEGQANLVNIRLAKKTRTLLFTEGDGVKRADGLL